ncbi:MAG TPA: sodium:solute symporter, partial [Bacteroidales bacterium]|nr:sodium:solute symporter [Bacteroidales bacterium]
FIGCIIGTYTAKPTDAETLESFYTTVKPWGFWKPILARVQEKNTDFVKNTRFFKDSINVIIGVVAQTALVTIPIFIVIKEWVSLSVAIGVFVILSVILKFTWWDKLKEI